VQRFTPDLLSHSRDEPLHERSVQEVLSIRRKLAARASASYGLSFTSPLRQLDDPLYVYATTSCPPLASYSLLDEDAV
jgi:hypothetical protein